MGFFSRLKERRDNKMSKCRNCGKETLQKDLRVILIDKLATEVCPDCLNKEFDNRLKKEIDNA